MNFGFLAYPSPRRRPSRNVWGCGFGRSRTQGSPPTKHRNLTDWNLPGLPWGQRSQSWRPSGPVDFMTPADSLKTSCGGPPHWRDRLLEEEAFSRSRAGAAARAAAHSLLPLFALRPMSARYLAERCFLYFAHHRGDPYPDRGPPSAVRRMIDLRLHPRRIAIITPISWCHDRPVVSPCWPGQRVAGSTVIDHRRANWSPSQARRALRRI